MSTERLDTTKPYGTIAPPWQPARCDRPAWYQQGGGLYDQNMRLIVPDIPLDTQAVAAEEALARAEAEAFAREWADDDAEIRAQEKAAARAREREKKAEVLRKAQAKSERRQPFVPSARVRPPGRLPAGRRLPRRARQGNRARRTDGPDGAGRSEGAGGGRRGHPHHRADRPGEHHAVSRVQGRLRGDPWEGVPEELGPDGRAVAPAGPEAAQSQDAEDQGAGDIEFGRRLTGRMMRGARLSGMDWAPREQPATEPQKPN